MRTLLPLLLLATAGCPRHHATLRTLHANDVMLGADGTPSHDGGGVHRCPSGTGEGKIELRYDNGEKRIRGECRAGVRVGDWKAWYDNGAVVWEARFADGLLD